MSSTEEYQQQEFWFKQEIENFKKQQDLLFQDLLLFGECGYQLEPEFKRIDPREIDPTEYEERE